MLFPASHGADYQSIDSLFSVGFDCSPSDPHPGAYCDIYSEIVWDVIRRIVWHADIHSDILSDHTFWHSIDAFSDIVVYVDILSGNWSEILTGILPGILSDILPVQQGPESWQALEAGEEAGDDMLAEVWCLVKI